MKYYLHRYGGIALFSVLIALGAMNFNHYDIGHAISSYTVNQGDLTINESADTDTISGFGQKIDGQADRIVYNYPININNLSFDFYLDNCDVASQTMFAGFYFSRGTNQYIPSGYDNRDDEHFTTFTFIPNYVDGQDRFAIYRTDDVDLDGDGQPQPYNHISPAGGPGWGIANQLVLSHRTTMGLNLTFENAGPYYKLIIKEKYQYNIWSDNANYFEGSTYTYIEKTLIPTTAEGLSYLNFFAYSNNDINNPIISLVGIKNDTIGCNVSFQTNNGVDLPTLNLQYGDLVPTQPDLSKDSYEFKGWFSDPYYNQKWNFDTDRITSHMTLYAKWDIPENPVVPDDEEKKNEEKKEPELLKTVYKMSWPIFILLCLLGAAVVAGLVFLIIFLIKHFKYKKMAHKILSEGNEDEK